MKSKNRKRRQWPPKRLSSNLAISVEEYQPREFLARLSSLHNAADPLWVAGMKDYWQGVLDRVLRQRAELDKRG